jgi:antitoxin (DNA-binding transcriptional repressor) of toxin-antitoxin stability system
MSTVSVQEAQARLSDLIHALSPGDEVVILEGNRPVARLLPAVHPRGRRRLGSLAGSVTFMAPDFDAPLDDFREYMEVC